MSRQDEYKFTHKRTTNELEHDDSALPETKRSLLYGWDGSNKVRLAVDASGNVKLDPTNLDARYWQTAGDQTLLTGDKSGSFDLTTTGTGTFGAQVTIGNSEQGTIFFNGLTADATILWKGDGTDYFLFSDSIHIPTDRFLIFGVEQAASVPTTTPSMNNNGADLYINLALEEDMNGTLYITGTGLSTPQGLFTGSSGMTVGYNSIAPTVNVPGVIKLWSAGNNAFITTFTAGTQTATATYTLPTAMATANSQALLGSTAGVLSWGTDFGANTVTTTGTVDTGILDIASTTSTDGKITQNAVTIFQSYVPANQAPSFKNIFIGENAGNYTLTNVAEAYHGTGNVGVGANVLDSLTTGFFNICLGINAGTAITTGSSNVIMGHTAGTGLVDGQSNFFLGRSSGQSVISGNENVAIGLWTARGTTGSYNVAIGSMALYGNYLAPSAQNYNTVIGYTAGFGNLTGSSNVFIGAYSGKYETASSKLFIDNQDRTNEATARTNSLIYGIFNSTVASQSFTINAGNVYLPYDNEALVFGTGNDASIAFDSNSLNIKSNLITATDKLELTAGTSGLDMIIGSTSQIILTDGKLSATTNSDIDLGDATHFWQNCYFERVGVNTAVDGTAMLYVSGGSFPVFLVQKTTAILTGITSGFLLRTTTTGNMENAFGGGFVFAIQDEAGVSNSIARISAQKDSAVSDAVGRLNFDLGSNLDPYMYLTTTGLTIGYGTTTDYSLTFLGSSNGILTWMEALDYFQFSDDILLPVDEKIYFGDTSVSVFSNDDGYLDLNADTGIRVNNYVRHTSANYRRYYHLPVTAIGPGATGATWTEATANNLAGWQLNASTELLNFDSDVHSDWDGASNFTVEIYFQLLSAGSAGDTVDLKMNVYYMTTGDSVVKTQSLADVVVTTDGTQYKMYKATFTVPWDAAADIEAGDRISYVLNLETDTSEIDNILVVNGSVAYNTTHLGIESGDT